MKAVILVGGEGLRLRPLTCNIPKPMVPVVNRPFLEHTIETLRKHGVDEVILAICYLPDKIREYFGDGHRFGLRMTYAVEDTPLGTGGAIKNAEGLLTSTFLVLNGDIFTDLNLSEMIAFHRERQAEATIGLTPVDDPTSYGVVEVDSDSRVRGFVEKPGRERITSNLINAGLYVLEPAVLDMIPTGVFYMVERGLFPALVERGERFFGFESGAYWTDIGVPRDYLRLHRDILMGKAMARFPGRSVADDLWIEDGCTIHESARLVGPLVIGRDCVISEGAVIQGPTVIGKRCTIGPGSLVDQAVIWSNAMVGRDVRLRDCVIGSAGTIGDNAWVVDGAIVGDRSAIGDENRLERGVKVWPGATLDKASITF